MTLPAATQRMTRPLLLIAAGVVLLAFALWGATRGGAAALGAGLSVGNWFALRWLSARLSGVSGGAGSSAALSLLLMAKIGLLMAIVFVLINRVGVDAIGLAFGLGVLFVGPVLAALLTTPSKQVSVHPAVSAAREER